MSQFEIREEIPIKSFSIAAFICKIVDGKSQYLIIKRSSQTLFGSWQMVSGKIEKGETAIDATIREIAEETGLVPTKLYSADLIEHFYDTDYNVINLVPVFIAFVDSDAKVVLNVHEHSDYKWIRVDEARDYLVFDNQIEAIEKIEKKFVKEKPNHFLEVSLNLSRTKVYDQEELANLKDYSLSLVNDEHLEDIQNLCNNCADYYLLDKGTFADSDEAQKILDALPTGKNYDDQFNFGIFNRSNSLIALINIIKDYPTSNVWMLGLLLIDPRERNKGLGKLIHKELVKIVKAEKANKIRIGVLKENKNALKFWESIGYKVEKETNLDRGNNNIKKIVIYNYSI